MNAPVREFEVVSEGVRLAAEDYGGDGPGLVLVHGSGANLRSWDLLLPYIRDRFHVAAFDLRGHGRSEDGDQSADSGARDVAAVVSAAGLDNPIVLGHSWGVTIALRYGVMHHECRGLVLVDGIVGPFCYGTAPTWEALDASLSEPATTMTNEEFEVWLATDRRESLGLSPYLPWEAWIPLLRRCFTALDDEHVVMRPSPEQMREQCMIQMGQDAYELYDNVAARIIHIVGSGWDDEHAGALPMPKRAEQIDRLLRVRPDIRIEWLRCGHGIPLEMPRETAGLVIDFAARLPIRA